ncbi:hypothetical protein [Sphingopyxis sp. H115]|uniref:hypothetical protein n=1 Tax=Sphingopyxis sp. H115 TaxID=1759073 RepID=UPI0007367B98|nr:hypothetical protein [Sphingopyxis sp. H115]KTE08531.1 hypothetical protein ATE71_13750 [Sphingopyxis sp. H115]
MWQLIVLVLASGPLAPDDALNINGEQFGPPTTLTCTWFSNFENSQFEQCRSEAGETLLSDERASVECSAETCEALDAGARRVAQWWKPDPPWGTFSVKLVGRISLQPHQGRHLGDGTRIVTVEKILSVSKAE